jgi:hypothetical protein
MTSVQPLQRASRFSISQPKRATNRPPPRLLVYGEPGIGKTTFGASAPGAVLIPTEDGSFGLDVPRIPNDGKCETWQSVIMSAKVLLTEQHDFRWAVIDTINQAAHLCDEMVCQRDFDGKWNTTKGSEGFNAFGKGEKSSAQEFRQLLNILDQLQQKRGMGVIMLCHVGLQKQANALGPDFYKFAGDMGKATWSIACSWADQVGHACREMRASVREGETKAKASAIGNERWLIFEGGPGRDAKSRAGYDMPSRILLAWDEYAEQLASSPIDALIAQALELIVSAPDGARLIIEKRLQAKATDETLRSIGKTKLEQLINWLLSKVNEDR